jgi:hypothetical protein
MNLLTLFFTPSCYARVAGLFRVKALYQRGVYYEAHPEDKRLAFIRWLYLQGRLES